METKSTDEIKRTVQEVKVKVDFDLVWAIMWRWIVLIFCLYIALFSLVLLVGGLMSLGK